VSSLLCKAKASSFSIFTVIKRRSLLLRGYWPTSALKRNEKSLELFLFETGVPLVLHCRIL